MGSKKKSEIISSILTPAIKFWVRSQLNSTEELDIKIDAGDKQILTGRINKVFLEAKQTIYQGIYINKAEVNTQNIAVNLGEILRGKPLKLLNPIYVVGDIEITSQNLHDSLQSHLLKQALTDLVKLLLENQELNNIDNILQKYDFDWKKLVISEQKIAIYAQTFNKNDKETKELFITAHLLLKNNHEILLNPIEIQGIKELNNIIINDFSIDLGKEVELKKIEINTQKLHCTGKIKVIN